MGVVRQLSADIGKPTSLVRELRDRQQAKADGTQMNRSDIGGVMVRLFPEEAKMLLGFLEINLDLPTIKPP